MDFGDKPKESGKYVYVYVYVFVFVFIFNDRNLQYAQAGFKRGDLSSAYKNLEKNEMYCVPF